MGLAPIAVVVGSTGKQGTGVVQSLLKAGKFHVKALSRDSRSAGSQKLAALGAEVVECDSFSQDDLLQAFQGAQAVFGQTPHAIPGDVELRAAKAQAAAAEAVGVESFIFSSLENVERRSQGRYDVPFFTAKGKAVEEIQAELPRLAVTAVELAYFYTNFVERFRPKPDTEGVLTFSLPVPGARELPWTDPMSSVRAPSFMHAFKVGPVVNAILDRPQHYKGQVIPIVNEMLSPDTMVQQFTEVTGVKARYQLLSREDVFASGLPEEMCRWQWDMYQYTLDLGYYAPERDTQLSRKLHPQALTWRQFLEKSGFTGTQSPAEVRAKHTEA